MNVIVGLEMGESGFSSFALKLCKVTRVLCSDSVFG